MPFGSKRGRAPLAYNRKGTWIEGSRFRTQELLGLTKKGRTGDEEEGVEMVVKGGEEGRSGGETEEPQ